MALFRQCFYRKSEIRYSVTLGSSKMIEKTVTHGRRNLIQGLRGCIAEAVQRLGIYKRVHGL